ncbi:MAG: AzlC family ABC transporter permease [Oscillospiraceae bacterium]
MKLTFRKGFKDGLPILMGYFSVSFAFGMLAVSKNFSIWVPVLISFSNFTGTGQFAGLDLMYAGAACVEVAFTVLIINLRYSLMSLSLSQKLHDNVTLAQRFAIAFGNTDEIYAVAMKQESYLNARYMAGLILSSYIGWTGGTIIGAVASSIVPESVLGALGIALYAMFIAIIIPPARENSAIAKIILIAVAMSCMFRYIPILSGVSSGWVIIICGVVSSVIGAVLFPIKEDNKLTEKAEEVRV